MGGMTSWYESAIDRQIREAQERGEFDNLPGTGQPLPDRGELYDENWWLKEFVRRENITGIAPTSLRVRKETEKLMERLAYESTESAVRRVVADLNERIRLVNLGHTDGPPVVLRAFDVDEVVQSWREQKDAP